MWKHVHPLWIIFQIGSGYGLQISCTIPICVAKPISPTREDLWCFLIYFLRCTLGMHIEHPSIIRATWWRTMPPTRLWMWVLVSCMLNCFCKPTLGSQISASQLMRSSRQRERNICHFRPCPDPIKFDFTRICVETMVYIHLANSWDHDVMCPSLIFLIKELVLDFGPRWKSFTWPGFQVQ